jgi:limonene-1,2-epoxide hydrolase
MASLPRTTVASRPAGRVEGADGVENKRIVEAFWDALYQRDLERVAAFFAEDGHYEDVPAPDPGATGPANVVRRLAIGLEPIERYEHELHRMVCEGDTVVTEHTETWHWHTGESVSLPFVSIHVLEAGRIRLWRDYWDLQTLMSAAPAWWIERLAKHTPADFGAA